MDSQTLTRMSLEEFMEEVRRSDDLELRVCLPARVISWIPPVPGPRPTPPRALVLVELTFAREARAGDVKPGEQYVPDEDLGRPGEARGMYTALTVPVHFPGPKGMWSRGPLQPGEQGKIVFADRSLDLWQIEGGPVPVDPGFSHTHGFNMHDGWFEPGVRSGAGMVGSDIPTDGWAIGTSDGLAGLKIFSLTAPLPLSIELTTTGQRLTVDALLEIHLGALADDFVARAGPIMELFTNLASTLGSWVPPVAPVIDNGLALKTALLLPFTGFIAKAASLVPQIPSTKVWCE